MILSPCSLTDKTETAMQQQHEYIHIVRLEAAADADFAGRTFHQYLAFIVAIELVGGIRKGLLVEHQHAADASSAHW